MAIASWMRGVAVLVCSLGLQLGHSAELFAGDAQEVGADQALPPLLADHVAGGRAIYRGGSSWYINSAKVDKNNWGIRFGRAELVTTLDGKFFAAMYLNTNLDTVLEDGYYTYDACQESDPTILLKIKKPAGNSDDCLKVRPFTPTGNANTNAMATGMRVDVMQTRSRHRLYSITMLVNLEPLGLAGSRIADWSKDAVEQDPKKKRFMEKVTLWASKLQEGVALAIDFKNPADAFKDVPDMAYLFDPLYASPQPVRKSPPSGSTLNYCPSLERMVQEGVEACPQ